MFMAFFKYPYSLVVIIIHNNLNRSGMELRPGFEVSSQVGLVEFYFGPFHWDTIDHDAFGYVTLASLDSFFKGRMQRTVAHLQL